jgi:hypothetical protein
MFLNAVFDAQLNMVFNRCMKPNQYDIDLIRKLGGSSKVAELLGLDKQGGAQRVQNWLARGIPAQVKVDFPSIFMPELAQAPATIAQAATESAQGATRA